ncbi:MAG: hypothetical protein HYS13_16590 [Planctomycetia bacterium]|nr:hypothetical protein [Planctomycetia bacterium]
MSRKKKHDRPAPPSDTRVACRKVQGQDAWELVHPRCALERADDLADVQAMLGAGEIDVARDEVRWLLKECSDFIAGHRLLGELALAEEDYALARGHFGYAFRIGLKALGEPLPGLVPYARPDNQGFLESGKGLAFCLDKLGKREMALEVVETLLALDPSDPLAVGAWRKEWSS